MGKRRTEQATGAQLSEESRKVPYSATFAKGSNTLSLAVAGFVTGRVGTREDGQHEVFGPSLSPLNLGIQEVGKRRAEEWPAGGEDGCIVEG